MGTVDPAAIGISNVEWGQLQRFRARVADLKKKGLVTAGKTTLTVTVFGPDHSKGLIGLDEDQFVSFLTTLRQFVLVKDDVSFMKIYKLISAKCKDNALQQWMDYALDIWQATLVSSPIGIEKKPGEYFTIDDVLSLLLYSGIVHSDQDKVDILAKMPESTKAILKMTLVSGFRGLCHALVTSDLVIDHWVNGTKPPPLTR